MDAKQISKGDKVKDKYGRWHTVSAVYANMIIVADLTNCINESNVTDHIKRYWCQSLQKYVTVPGAE